MLDGDSVRAVDAARRGPRSVRPLADGYTFAALPPTVERLLAGGDGGLPAGALGNLESAPQRVVLVLLDAFGWRFLMRHAEHHPLLRRLFAEGTVAKLATQFPSTTAAHVTTLHTGWPVGEHGLYEWNMLDPGLGDIVTPMMFSFAGDRSRDTLHATGLEPAALYPEGPTLYRRLAGAGVAGFAFEPASFAPSTYDGVLLDGATLLPYRSLEDGLAAAARTLRTQRRAYAYVYIDAVDATGHEHGPSSPEFDAQALRCLDAIAAVVDELPAGTLLLLAADHGQVDVDPARTMYVDELWPELARHVRRGASGRPLAPAGSPRDLFLHTRAGMREAVLAGLRSVLGERAEVRATAELVEEGLFGDRPGERLAARVGDVCVLPGPGETVWWRERGRFEMRFRGHHGGLTPEEAETFVASLLVA